MKTIQKNSQVSTLEIILKGWKTLIKELGKEGATKFLRAFSFGQGNSVNDFRKMWQGMDLEKIHKEILKAKKEKEI